MFFDEASMTEKILCVDDDANILQAFRRNLHKQFVIETAPGGESGLEAVRNKGPFAVIVSDMQMPGMNGVQFLAEVRECSPDSVRIMLTGQADVNSAIAAVNEGNIFRFLTKPCPHDVLINTLKAALEQHRLITAERTLLEKTLHGSIKVLTDVLTLVNPAAFGRASRLKRCVQRIATHLHLPDVWQFELAAMLSQIGCVMLPPDTLEKIYAGQELSTEEQKMWASYPAVGHDLLVHIPRLETIADMIARQQEPLNNTRTPEGSLQQDIVSLGAHMLKVALDFDQLVTRGLSPNMAVIDLQKQPETYDPQMLLALQHIGTDASGVDVRTVKVGGLMTGMILDEDVRTKAGALVIPKGHEVTYALKERLLSYARKVEIIEPFRVLVPRSASSQAASDERPPTIESCRQTDGLSNTA
jgi:response regulator RpfG family c-di-GMP phosphodiesterase